MSIETATRVAQRIRDIPEPDAAVLQFLVMRLNALGGALEETYNKIRGPGKELVKIDLSEPKEVVVEKVRTQESLLSGLAKIVAQTKIATVQLGKQYTQLYGEFLIHRAVFDRFAELYERLPREPASSGAADVHEPTEPISTREETSEPEAEQCQAPPPPTNDELQEESIPDVEPETAKAQPNRRQRRSRAAKQQQ